MGSLLMVYIYFCHIYDISEHFLMKFNTKLLYQIVLIKLNFGLSMAQLSLYIRASQTHTK